jgi:hypothetical protein
MRSPITEDDAADQLLMDLVNGHRKRWKLISQQLEDFAEGECQNR